MKNGVRLFSVAVAAGLVGFMSLAAAGEEIVTNKITASSSEPIVIAANEVLQVDCGSEITLSGLISGEGKIYKTGGKKLIINCRTNTFSGGVYVEQGTLAPSNHNVVTSFLGTGLVQINNGNGAQYSCGTRPPNDLEIFGYSSSKTAFNIAAQVMYSGDIYAHDDFRLSDSYTNRFSDRDSDKGIFNGAITVAPGHTMMAAPNIAYRFNKPITADCLKGFWEKNSNLTEAQCPTLGRCGCFIFNTTNTIGKLEIEQTRFTCAEKGADDFVRDTVIEFTGTDHLCDGWGYLDLNGHSLSRVAAIITPAGVGADTPGCQISNSATKAVSMTITGRAGLTANAVLKLCGAFNPLKIAPDLPADFTQVFRDCAVPLEPELTLNSGTIGFEGSATAPAVTRVTLGKQASLSIIGETCQPFADNQIVLSIQEGTVLHLENDLTVQKLFLDEQDFPRGEWASSSHFMITGGGTLIVSEGPDPESIVEVTVPEGEVVTNVTISGEKSLRKFGAGRLVITDANKFSGGTAIYDGVLEITDRNALGSGDIHISGSTTHPSQLYFNAVTKEEEKFQNNIFIDADSTTNFPAIFFAHTGHLGGTVTARANLYLATYLPASDSSQMAGIKFFGRVTAEENARIAGAPHMLVCFQGGLSTPLLECYYTEPGHAANGGNSGGFRLHNPSEGANEIGRISIDQTFVKCSGKAVCMDAIVSFDGAHKLDGVGYFDLAGYDQTIYLGETAVCSTTDGGQQITNSVTTATPALTVLLKSSNCYAKFDGPMSLNISSSITTHLCNRRHTMAYSGTGTALTHASGTIYFDTGTAFPYINSLGGNTGGTTYFSAADRHVFDNVARINAESHNHIIANSEMAKGFSRGHRLSVTCNSSGNYGMCVAADLALDAASLTAYSFATGTKIVWPCGEYTKAEVKNMVGNGVSAQNNSGKIRVWAARTAWTNVTWKGAADADFGDKANWTNTDDGEASAATFGVPLNKATITGGSGATSATANGIVNFGKLTVSTGFSVGGSGIVAFYDDGLETGGNGSTVTFNVPVDFQTDKFVVAAGDTVKFAGGLTNEVDDAAIDEYVVPATNAGTIELGGVIPAKLTVNGGTLAIAANATLPTNDTLVLVLAAGAKISVPNGMVLRTKTTTVAGNQVGVGYYYADGWVTGGGKVRVAESTTTPTIETTTWNAAGSDGRFSKSENWNPDTTEMSWAGKYRTVFAAQGTGAVVDGAFNLVDMTFDEGSAGFAFTGSEGASLTLAEGLKIAEKTDVTVERTFAFGVPVTNSANLTLAIPSNDTVVCAAGGSFGALTLAGKGRMEVAGETAMNGTTLVSNTVLAVSGTLSGTDNLILPFVAYGQTAITSPALELNEATLKKTLKLSDISTECKCHIRSSAPIGTTNYIATASDGASMHTYFERGRTFVIDSWSMSGKHEFLSIGNANDGRVTVVLTWASQSVRTSPDGHLTISSGVDLILGQTSQTNMKSNKLVVNSGGSVTFTTDDAFVESYARGDRQAAFKLTGGDVYMGGTHQNCSILNGAATVHGDAGSEIEMLYGAPARTTSGNDVDPTFTGNLAEHVSLTMNGLLTNTLNGVSSTDGKITVKAGTLVLGANASLKNASEVKVEGGVLVVNAMDPFSRETTALTVTGGAIEVAAEKSLGVASAMVNGVPVEIGTYTTEQPGLFENILTGGGKIRVGKVGMMLILK